MKIPVTIADQVFPSKAAARQDCRLIRDAQKLKAPISDPTHVAFLRGLFDRHPEAEQKLGGSTIEYFMVKHNQFGTRSFFVVKSDGSVDDFSFEKCL